MLCSVGKANLSGIWKKKPLGNPNLGNPSPVNMKIFSKILPWGVRVTSSPKIGTFIILDFIKFKDFFYFKIKEISRELPRETGTRNRSYASGVDESTDQKPFIGFLCFF